MWAAAVHSVQLTVAAYARRWNAVSSVNCSLHRSQGSWNLGADMRTERDGSQCHQPLAHRAAMGIGDNRAKGESYPTFLIDGRATFASSMAILWDSGYAAYANSHFMKLGTSRPRSSSSLARDAVTPTPAIFFHHTRKMTHGLRT